MDGGNVQKRIAFVKKNIPKTKIIRKLRRFNFIIFII